MNAKRGFMKVGNLGLIGGLMMLAGTTAMLLEHKAVGASLGVVGLAFAVINGLSERSKSRAVRKETLEQGSIE